MIEQQTLEGRWNDVTGQILRKWSQLADEDLREVKGNAQKLIGLIQRKTGETRERIEHQLDEWLSQAPSVAHRVTSAAQQAAATAQNTLESGYERVADSVRHGYRDAERAVRHKPVESVAVAFGAGLIAGVVLGILMRSR